MEKILQWVRTQKSKKFNFLKIYRHQFWITQSQLSNNYLKNEKQKSNLSINKKKIEISLRDMIFDFGGLCCKQNLTSKILTKTSKLVNEKISINHIIAKLIDYEKLKFVLFSEEELKMFNNVPNLEIFYNNSKVPGEKTIFDNLKFSNFEPKYDSTTPASNNQTYLKKMLMLL
jgi:hypothetical protein